MTKNPNSLIDKAYDQIAAQAKELSAYRGLINEKTVIEKSLFAMNKRIKNSKSKNQEAVEFFSTHLEPLFAHLGYLDKILVELSELHAVVDYYYNLSDRLLIENKDLKEQLEKIEI